MMQPEVADKLLALNRRFYGRMADSFADSRQHPMHGFYALLPYAPSPPLTVLDVGCGNGRFGDFLQQQGVLAAYTGVDFSSELLAHAAEMAPMGAFVQRDMSRPHFLDGLGPYDLVACMAAMHHLPGRANRLRLLQELAAHLVENGRLFLANWQFMDSARQRRKVTPWAEIGLTAADVEPHDYLLTWQRSGVALRYACMIDEAETAQLAQEANLRIVHQFREDGKERNLSLYTVLAHE